MNGKPDQKISYKEKIKDINKVNSWSARTLDYYIASTGFTQTSVRGRNIKMLYDAYNGVMPQEYFNHVTNPLNNPNGEYSFPSKIRPYPLLRPNIDLLRGEFIKRPFNWTIKRTGEDAYNEKYDKLYKQVLTNIKQHFVNELVQTGIAPEEAEQQVSYPDEVKIKFSSNYKDEKAYKAQKLLEHFMYKYDIKEELNRGFLDYLIAGEAYFYTYPCDGDLEFKRVSPLYIDYDKSVDSKDIEDAEWIVEKMDLTFADMLDMFAEELTEEDITLLHANGNYSTANSAINLITQNGISSLNNTTEDYRRNKIAVFRVVWKTFRKVGILKYLDEFGQEQELIVDETYKSTFDEKMEWIWVNEIWQGYKIGEKVYKNIKRLDYNLGDIDNPSKCKMPYNGSRFSDVHTQNKSVLELGLPIYITYLILQYRLELVLAKHEGRVFMFDVNAIPRGWDVDKFIYYMKAMGIVFIDRNALGVDKSWNQYSAVDLSQMQHMSELINLLEYYKKSWDDILGITDPRKGQTQASETATGTERSVFQSSVITENIFSSYEQLTKRVLQSVINWGKFLTIDGKKFINVTESYGEEEVSIDPSELLCDLGIFISNSTKEQGKLDAIKGSLQALIQNGANPYMIAQIIDSDNYVEIKRIINKLTAGDLERQQAQQQAEQENMKQIEQMKIDAMNQQKAFESDLLSLKAENEIKIETNKAMLDMEKIKLQSDLDNLSKEEEDKEVQLKKLENELKMHNDKMEIEREKLKSQEKIAAMKPAVKSS